MGKYLYENFTPVRERFEEASDTLSLDFKKLCFEGPESELTLTENTQPALLLISTVSFEVVQNEFGAHPQLSAGHSVGEYAAMVCAEVMRFSDAIRAVRLRGQAMQRAVPVGQGGMCAVMGLSDSQVEKLCGWVQAESKFAPLEPANFNSPGQVVISGSAQAIDWMRANYRAEIFAPETPRAKFIPLNVSAPFHCRLMKPAEEEMSRALQQIEFRSAKWPIVQNFSATESVEPERLRRELVQQVSGAVRWTQSVLRLKTLGIRRAVEFGPGRVLSGLVKKIDGSGELTVANLNSLEDLRSLEGFLNSGPTEEKLG